MEAIVSLADDNFLEVGLPALMEQSGQSAVYEDGQGTQTSLTAIVGPLFDGDERTDDFPGRIMTIAIADVANPRAGDKITVLGNDWIITQIDYKSATAARLVTRIVR